MSKKQNILIRVIKKIFFKIYCVYSYIINRIIFSFDNVSIGKKIKTFGVLFIDNKTGFVSIGDNSILRSGYYTNPGGGMSKLLISTRNNAKIIIGKNVGISNSSIRSSSSIVIEDNVLIGSDCKIYDSDFHAIDYIDRINNENVICKPIIIKEGAWIGAHSIVLKGVTIGKHCVVGAGSVVTKSIPDGEIWAGNPAHFIKKIEK